MLKGAGRRPPPLVVHGVQGGEGVPQLVHGGHALEAEAASDVLDGSLAGDQDVLVVEFGEHAQRRVRHHNLEHNRRWLNVELDLPRLFGLLCTAVLIG